MKKQSLNALAASYRADLLYYIERAKLGKCPPHWQAYCFGEIAAAKGTDAYPEDGDALLDELHRLVDTVPQITNREESAAEIAAYRGQMLFYFDRDYYTLAELVRLPDRKKYGACVYIDADGSRQDRPGYANDIALQVDEWRRENGIPFDKSTIAAYRGQMLFYFDRDYYTLAELVRLPDRKKYGACVYIDADGSRQDRPGYANDIALQVDEWRRENGIPFDKSTIAASPSEVDGGEFDTMDEALRYLYTCLNFPDSVLC